MSDLSELEERVQKMLIPASVLRALDNSPVMENFTNPNWTSKIHKAVVKWITDFDEKLDPSHELGVRLVSFGQVTQFYLEHLDYCDSPLLLFKGVTEEGNPVELIQHVSQISILLIKLPKQNPGSPKRKIGFHTEHVAE